MNEGRFRITGVRVGSSARSVEQAPAEVGSPPPVRVRAGSAARMAEDAKRAGGAPRQMTAGFSLRGQGGRVIRQQELSSHPQRDLPERDFQERDLPEMESGAAANRSALRNEPPVVHAAVEPAELTRGRQGDVPSASAVPLQTTVGRLQSMFRALFKTGEPSKD